MNTSDNNIQALLDAANAPVTESDAAATPQSGEAKSPVVLLTDESEGKTDKKPEGEPVKTAAESEAEEPAEIEKTIEDIVKENANEADDKPASSFSLNKTLGGVIMARAIQKQIGLVLLITAFLIIYISNRYMCQKQTVAINKLEKRLTETRYKATVCTSLLTENSRESNILRMLREKGDSTLKIPTEPPYRIKVEK